MLVGAAGNGGDWLMGGHTYANDRYSPLDQITSANVGALAPVAIVQTGYTASFETTPVVVDGVMYATTPTVNNRMKVMALDAATGARIWETTSNLGTFKICCGPVNRGAAVAYGNVYVLTLDDRLIALDARTGAQRWSVPVADATAGFSETMTPQIYAGTVIVGSAGVRECFVEERRRNGVDDAGDRSATRLGHFLDRQPQSRPKRYQPQG